MFALGLVLQPDELKETLQKPKRIVCGILTQYTVMPLLGFSVAWFCGFSHELALGFIIVGCAPGAMASNVIVYLAGGAVAYSITLTTLSTALSPLLTPSLVEVLGGVFMPIPFWPMMKTILFIVLLPLLLGIGLQKIIGKHLDWARNAAPALAALAIVIICGYAVASNQERISTVGWKVFLMVVLLNALGFGSGWFLGRWYGFDFRHRMTLSIEIGMQNAGLGVALALKHFGPETALPGALFAGWCVLTSAGASSYFHSKNAFGRKNKGPAL